MARKLRVQYPGAIYHVMNRGDRREAIFIDDQDRVLFLDTLAEACEKTDWQERPAKGEDRGTAAAGDHDDPRVDRSPVVHGCVDPSGVAATAPRGERPKQWRNFVLTPICSDPHTASAS